MSYTTSPYAPRARREAINLVHKQGYTAAKAAKKVGFHLSTIGRWTKKADALELHGNAFVPTLSTAAWTHPNALPIAVVAAIVAEREQTGRCAQVIHHQLNGRGIVVSLSSAKRTLERQGLTRSVSKWKRYRAVVLRPPATQPGSLVQTDTIHFIRSDGSRFYVFTLIDVFSRAAFAKYSTTCTQRASYRFVLQAQDYLGITIAMLQADNGPEFGRWFHDQVHAKGIPLRHSRVRQPNDNAYVERFNRTIQEECLSTHPQEATVQERLTPYLNYYNNERPHLDIDCQTPGGLLPRC